MAMFMPCDWCGGVIPRDRAPIRIIRVYQKDGNGRCETHHICDECDKIFRYVKENRKGKGNA